MLDERVAENIRHRHEQMLAGGRLEPENRLRTYYSRFLERFGPDTLAALDGVELLERIHLHGNQDSLVYWLEFKNDDDFPDRFGGIGGGSALKFGIYRARESGQWMTGSPQHQRVIEVNEAVDIARRHRDQFVLGARIIEEATHRPSEPDYERLQADLRREAPNVEDTAWGHKYFSLLFPEFLDDFHAPDWQRFHLIKVLRHPPALPGRYLAGREFRSIAAELGLVMNHLTTILNERNGSPQGYWRIGTSQDDRPRSEWPSMRDGMHVAIGWETIGDLSAVTRDATGKEEIKRRLQVAEPESRPQQVGRAANQIFAFLNRIRPGATVLASDGASVLGIGRVTSDYQFASGERMPHRHAVRWLNLDEWSIPEPEGLRTTVHLMDHPENLIEIERRLLDESLPPPEQGSLGGIVAEVAAALEKKGQVILYGPPGTGKTFYADLAARELAARSWYGRSFGNLSTDEQANLLGSDTDQTGAIASCTFHPGYGYEDFIEGFRPVELNGALVFRREKGVFKHICERAEAKPDKDFFLIIDEINRGDIPRIFGELITLLEKDKRGREVFLSLSPDPFSVPANVYLIGTMNTADRSIALLDTALRRRFGFIELMPDASVLHGTVEGIPLGAWLDALNGRIRANVGRDGRNLQVGHSYLMAHGRPIADIHEFREALQYEILPLLQEYCYEDFDALERILGTILVHREDQSFSRDLFRPDNELQLVQVLQQLFPEIPASREAVEAAVEEETAVVDDDESDDDR